MKAIGYFMLFVFSILSSSVAAQSARDSVTEARDMRAAIGLAMIQKNVRNPDVFVLESALAMPDSSVCYTYRAQNYFGGMEREYVVLTPTDKILRNVSIWNKHCAHKTGDELARGSYLANLAKFVSSRLH